jgi:SAM-dependent methyltransferase
MTPQAFDTAWRNDPSVAARYANAENATRPFAKRLVAKSGIAAAAAAAAPIRALDLATGTGALVAELYAAVPQEHWGSMSVLCGDVSASMLAYVQERGQGAGWAGLETGIVDGNVCCAEIHIDAGIWGANGVCVACRISGSRGRRTRTPSARLASSVCPRACLRCALS